MTTRKKTKKSERIVRSDEYKMDAVKLADTVGVTQAAKQLGIHTTQIYNWRGKLRVKESRTEAQLRLMDEKGGRLLKKGQCVLHETPEVKYAFIKSGTCKAPLTRQFEWLNVSSSGYYDWLNRPEKPAKRAEQSSVIDEAVRIAFEGRKHRYGSPRLHVHLNESGFPVALNTVAESMRRQELIAKAGRKFKATTNSAHKLPVLPNLLDQEFTCKGINEKWAGDITYLWTDEGWMYLAVVLDLFSRRVIGWSMSPRMTKELACDAMQMAIDLRTDFSGVIMHTDRGSQYCSKMFQAILKANGIRSSMSKKGDCYDNACSESFFHTLKVECIHGELFPTREIMREVVFEYIETDYNRTRHHTTIGNTSPVKHEMATAA